MQPMRNDIAIGLGISAAVFACALGWGNPLIKSTQEATAVAAQSTTSAPTSPGQTEPPSDQGQPGQTEPPSQQSPRPDETLPSTPPDQQTQPGQQTDQGQSQPPAQSNPPQKLNNH